MAALRRMLGTVAFVAAAQTLGAQTVTQRGFVDLRGTWFPQRTANDRERLAADVHARAEVFVAPAGWLRLAAGIDAAADSHRQVDAAWRLDTSDRGARRPALAVRRASATLSRGGFALDAGKQFIRWGKTDIVTPTDRFAPRDYLNVIDAEFLAVRGARAAYTRGGDTVEAVAVPYFTPSRIPLFETRWTTAPAGAVLVDVTDERALPDRTQGGVRWSHVGTGFEISASFYDGFNHLPSVEAASAADVERSAASGALATAPVVPVVRRYPRLRMYGGDGALPTPWFTLKGEAAYLASPARAGEVAPADDYVLYVVQLERQTGEWLFIGGYAGVTVTARRSAAAFAPDRGTARSFLGRASYTIDATRSVAVEAAVRQSGDGVYVKGEFSRAIGGHWRTTVAGTLIRGAPDDFLGQFRLNSNVAASVRFSF